MTRPPTAKMIAVLRELAKPGVVAFGTKANKNFYIRRATSSYACGPQVCGLLDRGLAEIYKPVSHIKFVWDHVRITPAGRKWLAEHDQEGFK